LCVCVVQAKYVHLVFVLLIMVQIFRVFEGAFYVVKHPALHLASSCRKTS
jgi:hypothetical protein